MEESSWPVRNEGFVRSFSRRFHEIPEGLLRMSHTLPQVQWSYWWFILQLQITSRQMINSLGVTTARPNKAKWKQSTATWVQCSTTAVWTTQYCLIFLPALFLPSFYGHEPSDYEHDTFGERWTCEPPWWVIWIVHTSFKSKWCQRTTDDSHRCKGACIQMWCIKLNRAPYS